MQHLYLSHWNDGKQVFVHSNVVKKCKKYHLEAVRFLYNCYRKKLKGAVINYDDGMIIPLAIQAFLSAIFQWTRFDNPVLLLVAEQDICMWHYHLRQATEDVALLTERNHENILNRPGVILSSLDNLNYVHPFRTNDFSVVIVDKMDTVATKMIFKKLSGSFNIALTSGDFIEERDRKILWSLLNWTNRGLVGKLGCFYESDQDHFKNLRDPYDDVWLRLAWNSEEGFVEDSTEEQEKYKEVLKTWARQNNLHFKSPPKNRRKGNAMQKGMVSPKKIKVGNEVENDLKFSSVTHQNEDESAKFSNRKNLFKDDANCDVIRTRNDVANASSKKTNLWVNVGLKQSTTNKRKFIFEPNLYDNNEKGHKLLKTTDVSKLKNRRYKTDERKSRDDVDSYDVKDVTSKLQETSIHPNKFKTHDGTDTITTNSKDLDLGIKDGVLSKSTGKDILNLFTCSPNNDDTVQTNDDSTHSDDSDVMLSILGGKFAQNPNDELGTNAVSANKRGNSQFERNDSNSLLYTLYGDEAEFVEHKRETQIAPSQRTNRTFESDDDELLSSLFDYSQVEPSGKPSPNVNDSKIALNNNLLTALFGDNRDDDDYKSESTKKLTDSQKNDLISTLFDD